MIVALLVGVATAHQPHAVLVDLAAAPDGRWLAILDPNDASQLLASDDGAHFAFVGGDPTDDDLTAIAFAGSSWMIGTADGAVWTGSWTRTAVVDGAIRTIDGGERALIATERGLIVGLPGSFVAEQPTVAFRAAAWGDHGARIAVDDDGSAWFGPADRPIVRLARLPGGRTAVSAEVGDAPLVGTDRGVYRWDGADWQPCGALPTTSTGDHAEAVHLLVASGAEVLAATGQEALFVSTDGCATFQRRWTGDRVRYDGIGYLTDPAGAFTFASADGDTLRVAGFAGIAVSDDAGATWTHPDLLPADYSRGISLEVRGPGRLYMGEYAGGVAWTDDGATWESSATGLVGLHGNDLVAGPARDEVWHVTDLAVHRSVDGAASFAAIDVPIARAREIRLLADGVWVLGGDEDDDGPVSRIASTSDGGASFTLDEDYSDVVGENAILDLQDVELLGEDVRIAMLQKPARLVIRRAGQWTQTVPVDGFASGLASWPPERGTRLIFATTAGVFLSDDGGEAFVAPTVPPDGHPRALIAWDDGDLLVIDRAGRTSRSEDGGETWARTPAAPVPAAVHDVIAAGPFAALGTYAGAWITADAGESWARAPRLQRLEAGGFHLVCADAAGAPCEAYADARDGVGGGVVLPVGGTLAFVFEGDAFTVLGPPVTARVDGVEVAADADGRVVVADGWHDVVLTTDRIDGARVDAVLCTSPGAVFKLPEGGGCGCGGGRASWAWIVAILAIRRCVARVAI